jgi:hypothetical protein
MSEDLNLDLEPIAAAIGFNDGANKGFWRIQPRDDEGQWIEMGADVLFRFRTGDGNLVVATDRGIYVGPAGRPGFARVMVPKDTESGLKAGVYEVESRNLQQFKAIIPDADGKPQTGKSRTDKFGKPVKTLEDSKLPALQDLLSGVTPITEEDQRLAKGELTDEERTAEKDGREKSPVANLPAGFEAENPDKVKDLLRESGIDPDEFDKSAAAPKTSPAAKDVAQEEATRPDEDPTDAAVKDVIADVAFDGDTTATVDDLLKKQESLVALRESGTTKKVPFEIDPGNVIIADNGEEATVLDVRLGDGSRNIPFVLKIQEADGTIRDITPSATDKLTVVNGRRGTIRRPAEPTPSPAPETSTPEDVTPATPEAPDAETTEPGEIDIADGVDVVMTDEGLAPANFPPSDRMDDGSDFDLPTLSDAELKAARRSRLTPLMDPDGTPAKYVNEYGKLVDAEDPFGMMAVLAKIYPNAKFTPEGALVLHRQKDIDGRIFELRANNSGKRAIIYSMRWTNPNDPTDYKEYQHKDDRHSVTSLFTQSNGPEGLLDRLIGRTDRNGRDWATTLKIANSKWKPSDSLFKRSGFFRYGPVENDRHKMVEIGANAIRLANGRAAVLTKDGIIKNSDIPTLWEAFREYYNSGATREERDLELTDNLYQVMYAVFGRVPLDERSHIIARKAVRAEFKRQFSSIEEGQSFGGLIQSASERMRGIYREPSSQVRSIRYASKDRTRPIETGMTVEYTNNVGETSILKVTSLVENSTTVRQTSRGLSSYDYGDNVIATDVNGKATKINALNLKILRDQNTNLGVYKQNLSGAALTQRRVEQGLITVPTPGESRGTKRAAGGTSKITPIPGQDTVITDPAPDPQLIEDFTTGDMLYSKGEGRPLGIIKATRPVTSRSGVQGIAFLYTKPDGTEGQVVYALGTEINPKKA